MDRRVVRDHGSVGRTAVLAVPVLFLLILFVVPVTAVLRVGLEEGPGQMFGVFADARTWSVLGFTVLQAALSTAATLS